jgi:hypothetical protein
MNGKLSSILLSMALIIPLTLSAQEQKASIDFRVPRLMPQPASQMSHLAATAKANSAAHGAVDISTRNFSAGSVNPLPLWTFNILAARDGDHHLGTIVGRSPFLNQGTDRVALNLVPLVIKVHRIATSINTSTFVLSTAPGDVTLDATAPDNTCLTAPNNIPVVVTRQSPIFNPAHFVFGNTDVGTTQYIDALQRGSFSQVLGPNSRYHVLFDPVRTNDAVVIDVPAASGLAITDPNFFAAFGFTICAPLLLVDINWFDSYLNGTVIPAVTRGQGENGQGQNGQGEDDDGNSRGVPFFLAYDTAWPIGDVTQLGNCCAGGYHGLTGYPISNQPYGVADFDRTNFFVGPPTGLDTIILSHEAGEFVNDPMVNNLVPPWGGTGQVGGCQNNLEVGDPLTGSNMPPVTMPNGFTYNLQELAFFSWFFGGPSLGANGWFSNNGTFLTDAGPVCPGH